MGLAIVEIVEFKGTVDKSEDETSSAFLLAVNGEYSTSYGRPQYEYPPDQLIEEYKKDEYFVGNANNWKDFYELCNKIVKEEDLFTDKLPGELVREEIIEYEKDHEINKDDISNEDIEYIVNSLI